jgi:hypothetical protein
MPMPRNEALKEIGKPFPLDPNAEIERAGRKSHSRPHSNLEVGIILVAHRKLAHQVCDAVRLAVAAVPVGEQPDAALASVGSSVASRLEAWSGESEFHAGAAGLGFRSVAVFVECWGTIEVVLGPVGAGGISGALPRRTPSGTRVRPATCPMG